MSDVHAHEVELAPYVVPLDHEYSRLLDAIGDRRFVLLGEATHGSKELYRERAKITELLIERKGFDAVAIEADWPDAHRLHRFVAGRGADTTPEEALRSFTRFPLWMWRNREVTNFARRLADKRLRPAIFGLDLYSLHASIDVVLEFLRDHDHDAYVRAKGRYGCFDHFGRDTAAYGYATGAGGEGSCEREVTQQLLEMQARTVEWMRRDGGEDAELLFQIEQNARLVKNAESYYRNMIAGGTVTWNLRDRHMAETVTQIATHLDRQLGRKSKVAIWAHNSHVGDARATQMGDEGELNVGQLMRETWPGDTFIVGFTTSTGTVTAAHDWDGPAKRMAVRPAIEGSHEHVLHLFSKRAALPAFIVLPDHGNWPRPLTESRLERAIGVIYRPRTERVSHLFRARIAEQFDALLHIDHTSAVTPLDPWSEVTTEDAPETYPMGL